MSEITLRRAGLADAAAITAVHCSTVDHWRDPHTREIVPATALDLYGRWRNGGPWMSVETCAPHLNQLLLEGHLPLVAELEGRIVAEAEFYCDPEPGPTAALHLSILYVHRDFQRRGLGRMLVQAGCEAALARGLPALTTQPETEAQAFYRRLGFVPWQRHKELQLRAEGKPPATLRPLTHKILLPPALALRIGRYQCGAQGWDGLWPALALPGWGDLPRQVWQGTLADTPVLLGLRQQLLDRSQADGYAWLPPQAPLAPAVAALGALAAQAGYHAVDLLLPEAELPALRQTFRLDYQTTVALWRYELPKAGAAPAAPADLTAIT
ncbi:MAG TPA: N-acetyltransferase [Chloroflexi bacterium]|nr:N-acetyltransferase [Chloroflexota bacterium]